jgi:hypothetical protein
MIKCIISILLSLTFIFDSCNNEKETNDMISESMGIIVYNFDYESSDDVKIYEDTLKTIFSTFNDNIFIIENDTFSLVDLSDLPYFMQKHNFKCKEFDFTPTVIHFFVKFQTKKYYAIEIGGRTMFIDKGENRFLYYSYEEYLLGFPISTDLESNVLKQSPNSDENIFLDKNFYWSFQPIEIQGDWMKVKTTNFCLSIDEDKFITYEGWLRYKKDGKLLIRQLFSC